MRKAIFALTALLSLSAAVPGIAGMTAAQKDECILASRNCSNTVDDIQTKIRKINKEIKKGTAVYTAEELRKLEQKLAEVKTLLADMEKH